VPNRRPKIALDFIGDYDMVRSMKCPRCQYVFKAPGSVKGGSSSRRVITPAQQAAMQAARIAAKNRKETTQ